jgi:3,4-dihydroxy-9,10-secoandrosta-1,3,5(10)-triene-9,17-dione 4,5-dioxygenase
MDDQPYRLAVVNGTEDRLVCSGWQVPDSRALDQAIAELASAGVVTKEGSADEATDRRVGRVVRLHDPGGAELELYCSPVLDNLPFVSPAGVSRFVTGELGMGHVVMATPAFEDTLEFYKSVLGFRDSDSMLFGGSRLRFLHCNPRHHSLALFDGDRSVLAHFMVEVATIDDVGYGLDRFEEAGIRIKQGLGRHSNDHMLSFYAQTPGRFDVEFGCQGRTIDDATWVTAEITRTSFWGHRRPPKVLDNTTGGRP